MQNEKSEHPALFIAGNFLSAKTGTRGMCEDLTIQLHKKGFLIFTASDKPNRIARMADLLWTAWRNRKRYQLAIVEVYSGLAFEWAWILSKFLRFLKKPFIAVLHGGKLAEFYRTKPKKVSELLNNAALICSPSLMLQSAFQKEGFQVEYLPNGIDLSLYPFRKRETIEPNIVWLRAIHEIYNPLMAIQAFKLVLEAYPEAKLWMIGPDKADGTMPKLVAEIESLLRPNNIQIVGAVAKADVPEWLNKADIFINTTNYESFGVSVVEAIACGLPVVSTNAGELPLLWKDGEEILLVPKNDAQGMAKKIVELLNGEVEAEPLVVRAKEKAEQFDWEKILPQWVNLIYKVLGRGN
ncbi:MAG: glycosyltransferase family 4 protein [Anaerolineaceae bacterium]|nr:glycosyltransferase family 4 protein [Anaerolineaceae bacterium]